MIFFGPSKMCDAIALEPDRALKLILMILSKDDSVPVVQILAAGPLEDLLDSHGEAMIEKIEAEVRRNPKFAFLLGEFGRVRSRKLSGGNSKHCVTVDDGMAFRNEKANQRPEPTVSGGRGSA